MQRGVHYWNRLPDGTEIDLTRDQFGPAETVTAGVVAPRSAGPLRRCRGQYELLRHRVHAPASDADPGEPPTRIALVLLTDPTGAVLLQLRDPDARAEPGQWSLPGGHVEQGEDPGSAARRELAEETGLTVHSGLEPVWHAVRPDLTGATGSVEVHVYTGRTEAGSSDDLVIGEGQDARFVPAAGITAVDLSPTAAAVLHGTAYFRSCHMT